jgi:hypothetical protein
MKKPEEWLKELSANPPYIGATETWEISDIQQDAYQAGLKAGEIKGLERAVEMAKAIANIHWGAGIVEETLQSEIQKRK